MGNLPSCVECMDDGSAFPRTSDVDSGGMSDSASMQALPTQSLNGERSRIPITSATVEDIVQISALKPLGITLCDSDTAKGIFITGIKPEGNVAKLSQPVTEGMLLLELNGIDMTGESLENTIKKISDSPDEKRLILKFSGTKPVGNTIPTIDCTFITPTKPRGNSLSKSDGDSNRGSSESLDEKEKEGTDVAIKNEARDENIDTLQEQHSSEEQNTSDVASNLENKTCDVEEKVVNDDEEMSSPEVEDFGEFSTIQVSDVTLSTQSLDTVDMSTPTGQISTKIAPQGQVTRGDSKDLDTDLSDEVVDEKDKDESLRKVNDTASLEKKTNATDQVNEDISKTQETCSTSPSNDEANELLLCSRCDRSLSKSAFTFNQLKKKSKRKCKECK